MVTALKRGASASCPISSWGYIDLWNVGPSTVLLLPLRESGETTIGPVNLGNQSEFTVGELANMVRELAATTADKHELEIEYRTLPQDDPRR